MDKVTRIVIGFDIGDRKSVAVSLDRETGEMVQLPAVPTSRKSVRAFLDGFTEPVTIVLEASTPARWIALEGRKRGHQMIVADPRRLAAVTENIRKSDEEDAAMLARLGASEMRLLRETFVRDEAMSEDLAVVRMRDAVVAARTLLVNASRSQAKSLGERLPSCSTASFANKAHVDMPVRLKPVLDEAFAAIEGLSASIKGYDTQIAAICARRPAAARLAQEIPGVGVLTALCYVLTVADPVRFRHVRDVAAYIGLVPRRSQSGSIDRQMQISKTGNGLLRRLLVQSAHHILGPFGKESDLRTAGLALAARGAKTGKKKAVVATARKLAVVMLSVWKSGEAFEPVRKKTPAPAAA